MNDLFRKDNVMTKYIDLYKKQSWVDRMLDLFGATDKFQEEWNKRRNEIMITLYKEHSMPETTELDGIPFDLEFGEKSSKLFDDACKWLSNF